jgi:heme-degrading monooxygenase HmoA
MGTDIEYTALTLWSSVEAIKAFAGDDYERARYYPGDGKIFKFLNPKAEHFEVVCAEFPEAKFQIGAPPP